MPISGPLSHIDISVGYPDKSIPFYDTLLTSVGFQRQIYDHPDWQGDRPQRASWSVTYPDGSSFGIECRPADEASRDTKYDRYHPGPHHLAFHADSNETVVQTYNAILALGGEILDPPTEYGGHPAYGKQYFAAFFADPDGVKLEVVYHANTNP